MIFQYLLRIILASISGTLIGMERHAHYKAAGVNTHMIVAFSGALIMVVSKYAFPDTTHFDASRIASQFIAGIGFLGAGVIYKRKSNIEGLTTAAGIIATAAIGLALGAGMYELGLASTAIFLLIRVLMQHIGSFKSALSANYAIKIKHLANAKQVLSICDDYRVTQYGVERLQGHVLLVNVTMVFPSKEDQRMWLEEVVACEDILSFEKL